MILTSDEVNQVLIFTGISAGVVHDVTSYRYY